MLRLYYTGTVHALFDVDGPIVCGDTERWPLSTTLTEDAGSINITLGEIIPAGAVATVSEGCTSPRASSRRRGSRHTTSRPQPLPEAPRPKIQVPRPKIPHPVLFTYSNPKRPFTQRLPCVTSLSRGDRTLTIF